jgi:plastocyanin
MPAGSGDFQGLGAADEFADVESIVDYTINYLMVELGDTVTWTNDDPQMPHTVTDVGGTFDSGLLQSTQSFSYTFTNPGVFEYFCTLHPWMRAKVEVMMH